MFIANFMYRYPVHTICNTLLESNCENACKILKPAPEQANLSITCKQDAQFN